MQKRQNRAIKTARFCCFPINFQNQYFCIAPLFDETIILLLLPPLSLNNISKSEIPAINAHTPNRIEVVDTDDIFIEKSITEKTISTNGAIYIGRGTTEYRCAETIMTN